MSKPVPRLNEIIEALETREDTARSAAADAGEEAISEKLRTLADGLAQDRRQLTVLLERLRRDTEGRAGELTAGHGDENDPNSDLGL